MPNKHLLMLLAAGPLAVGRGLIALRLRRQSDGWRNAVGVGLRGEGHKFALAAFGLRPPADPVRALADFLPAQPAARFRLVHRRSVVRRVPAAPTVVGLRYAADGELLTAEGLPTADLHKYNHTRHLPERVRPRMLAGHPLFNAIGVTTETDFDHRFRPPDNTRYRGFGGGPFQFVLRPIDGTLDVWAICHHTANDGGAVAELLAALSAAWGATPVPYPPAGTAFEPRRCSMPSEREVYEATAFHDFGPLLAERKQLAVQGVEASVGALLGWRLAGRPAFAGARFAATVDVPAGGGYDRDVGMASIRPADFAGDLAGYAAAHRAGVELARTRRGPVRELMQGAALLPPGLFYALTVADKERTDQTFGTVGLSVLKGARVVFGTIADAGYPGGFIAVGGIEAGVGPVSVKGNREQSATYHAEIQHALASRPASRGPSGPG